MDKQQIVYIDTEKMQPHPDNPRKNIGDITELAESIKANGILQNLTAVRFEKGYRVIIGHRRLAAAKKANIKQVPCIISDMDEREQLITMLLENMQRSDLTVYEEAEGFQMMLDLGDSIDNIAEKTGFSKTTVRRRVNLLDLDREKFKDSVKRGGTLQDFIALEKIKDKELKNKVLEFIGTQNFNYELKRAESEEKRNEIKGLILKKLNEFAEQKNISETEELKYVGWISFDNSDFEKPKDSGKRRYFYVINAGGGIMLYAEYTEREEKELAEEKKQRKERDKLYIRLNTIAERTYQLRFEFIKNVSGLKRKAEVINKMLIKTICQSSYNYFNFSVFNKLLGIKDNKEKNSFDIESVSKSLKDNPERTLLFAVYSNLNDHANQTYHSWDGKYQINQNLNLIYKNLEELGYEMSDEERAYKDRTCELFKKEQIK